MSPRLNDTQRDNRRCLANTEANPLISASEHADINFYGFLFSSISVVKKNVRILK